MLTIEDLVVIASSFLKSQFGCCTLSVEAFKLFKLHQKDLFYEQQEGAAMSSPVPAIVANMYMEHFEEPLTSRSTGSLPTQTDTWISGHTTLPMSKKVW